MTPLAAGNIDSVNGAISFGSIVNCLSIHNIYILHELFNVYIVVEISMLLLFSA